MFAKSLKSLAALWSTCEFDNEELAVYARNLLSVDTRHGLALLGLISMTILLSSAALFNALNYEWVYSQTFLLLSLLCLHIIFSSRYIRDVQGLNLLGLTLVVIIGTAFVLLGQYAGKFNPVLLANVVLLFMVIPLVPWALRESCIAVGLIYGIFTLSIFLVDGRFMPETVALLQFLMISAAFATLTVVARQVSVRKHDILTRFELESTNRTLQRISYKDALTGTDNRRFLYDQFDRIRANYRAQRKAMHFALIDLDDFKQLNDNEGHDAGDKALVTLSRSVMASLEPGDYFFRLGGDEFALLFAAPDPEAWLAQLAERCRCDGLTVSFSTGLTTLKPDQEAELTDLYNLADGRLYETKRSAKVGRQPTLPAIGTRIF